MSGIYPKNLSESSSLLPAKQDSVGKNDEAGRTSSGAGVKHIRGGSSGVVFEVKRFAKNFFSVIRSYIRSPLSLIANKYYTGDSFTTGGIFKYKKVKGENNKVSYQLTKESVVNRSRDISEIKKEIGELENGQVVIIHTPYQGTFVEHSTLLAIGKSTEGENFALFLDVQGGDPRKVRFNKEQVFTEGTSVQELSALDMDGFEIESNPSLSGVDPMEGPSDRNPEDKDAKVGPVDSPYKLYEELITSLAGETPQLLYGTNFLQADRVSCTAYSAEIADILTDLVKKPKFKAEKFMEEFQDRKRVFFRDVRKRISGVGQALYDMIQSQKR